MRELITVQIGKNLFVISHCNPATPSAIEISSVNGRSIYEYIDEYFLSIDVKSSKKEYYK